MTFIKLHIFTFMYGMRAMWRFDISHNFCLKLYYVLSSFIANRLHAHKVEEMLHHSTVWVKYQFSIRMCTGA